MSILLFANIATTTLAGAITSTATTAQLAAGSGGLFPQPGSNNYYTMTFVDAATGLINEIVYVYSMSGDQITSMVRGQENTTARAWNAGDKASNYWTAGNAAAMIQVGQLQQQATNFAVDTGAVNAVAIALTPVPGNLAAMNGSPVRIKIRYTNSGPATVNLNGLGAVPLITMGNTPLVAGQLVAGSVIEAVYDSALSVFWLQSAPPNVSSNAVGGVLTGNLPNPGFAANPAFTGNVTATGYFYGSIIQTTPTGYLNIGTGPSNIAGPLAVAGGFSAAGVSSFGGNLTVAGTLGVQTNLSLLGAFNSPGVVIYGGNITLSSGTVQATNLNATTSVYAPLLATTGTGSANIGSGGLNVYGPTYSVGYTNAGALTGFPGRMANLYIATATVGNNLFTVPAGCSFMHVEMVGGGGGGSNCNWTTAGGLANSDASGGGGGAGAYAELWVPCSPGGSGNAVVGAGGAAQTAGGSSVFAYGAFEVTCAGGGGASFGSAATGSGAAGGLVTINNGAGGVVLKAINGGWGSDGQSGPFVLAGNGGASYMGGGGRAGSHAGTAGAAYGSGGGGAYDATGTGTAYAGGAGYVGVIYITYYS